MFSILSVISHSHCCDCIHNHSAFFSIPQPPPSHKSFHSQRSLSQATLPLVSAKISRFSLTVRKCDKGICKPMNIVAITGRFSFCLNFREIRYLFFIKILSICFTVCKKGWNDFKKISGKNWPGIRICS